VESSYTGNDINTVAFADNLFANSVLWRNPATNIVVLDAPARELNTPNILF